MTDSLTRGQQYVYDLAGRRTSMQWFLGSNGYSYTDFGALGTVTDPGSNQYRFVYTLDGQVDSLLLGTGVKEDRNYDADGRLTYRNRVSSYGSLGGLVSGTLTYDKMNRVIHSVEDSHGQITEDTRIAYDGLGAVLANEQTSGFGTNVEEFRNDAFGNVLYRKTQRAAGTNDAPFVLQYNPQGSLRIASAVPSNPPGQNQLNDDLGQSFSAGGQLVRQSQLVQDDQAVSLEVAARHYYSADDKLMAVQRYSYRPSLLDGTWEEYWYDALGRRVLTRARRDPASIYDGMVSGPLCLDQSSPRCRSFAERVWWDGDQALLEQRTPEGPSDVSNNGTIGNVHGLTLDEPLAVIADQTRIVNYNWRGQGESSVFPDGSPADASLGNVSTEIDWPALTQAQTYFTPGPESTSSGNPKRWLGTFVANGQGTTGMLYRRNRYFSPTSGQFTQADPIGIAGGMNAFGFAGGDPLNYSDPLGLIECPKNEPCENPMSARAVADRIVAVAEDVFFGVLDAFNDAADVLTGAKSTATAAGLNPSALDARSRIAAGVSIALSASGSAGDAALVLARGPGTLTGRQAGELADYLGYEKRVKDIPFNSHGQSVFTNGKNYITIDIDSHNGGVWKMFGRRGNPMGTFDAFLQQIKK